MADISSIENEQRGALPQLNWEEIREPGAYVEIDSGDLFRVPKEGLLKGASPLISKESKVASRFVMVSKNPYVTTMKARLVSAQHNVEPNF